MSDPHHHDVSPSSGLPAYAFSHPLPYPGPPAYAPTTTSSYTPAGGNPNVEFHQEVTRASIVTSSEHRAVYDTLCEIYTIITVLEMVENAFLKDFLLDKELYESIVSRMVSQYSVLSKSLDGSPAQKGIVKNLLPGVSDDYTNLPHALAAKFHMHAPVAVEKLAKGPVSKETTPAAGQEAEATSLDKETGIVTSSATPKESASGARLIAQATGNFITLMDAIKLNYNTKAQLHPLLSEVVLTINEVSAGRDISRPLNLAAKPKLVGWLIKLNQLSDTESLSREDSDRFLEDVEEAYNGFFDSL